MAACQAVCGDPPPADPPKWDCVSGAINSCVEYQFGDAGYASAPYTSLAACQAICAVPESWDCFGDQGCQDPGNGQGYYATQADCDNDCISTWRCDSIICEEIWPGHPDYPGGYTSELDCQTYSSCVPPVDPPTWECRSTLTTALCVQVNPTDPGYPAPHTTLAACNAVCNVSVPETWNCIQSSGQCVDPGTGLGQYTTYSACLAACQQPPGDWSIKLFDIADQD